MSIPMEAFDVASYFAGVCDTIILGGVLIVGLVLIWLELRIRKLEGGKNG